MSCNGCRVLRKGCSRACVLRPCLRWIDTAEAQGHATAFVARFFGRAAFMSLLSAVPDSQRPALFQSLLFEACGRTINPVGGAVGLLCTGNWHLCQAAVNAVLNGDALAPLPSHPTTGSFPPTPVSDAKRRSAASPSSSSAFFPRDMDLWLFPRPAAGASEETPYMNSEGSMLKVHRFLKIGLVETYGLKRIPCYIQHQNKYQDIQAAPVNLGGQIVIVK
ncbi:unnamed protein product [Musa banksii]